MVAIGGCYCMKFEDEWHKRVTNSGLMEEHTRPLEAIHTTGRATFSLRENMEKMWRKLHFFMQQTCRGKLWIMIEWFSS